MFETNQKNFLLREFQRSDFLTLLQIADAMNKLETTDKKYHTYYAFAVPYGCQNYQKILAHKIRLFLEKNEKEIQQNSRSTYRMAVCTPSGCLMGGIAVDMLPIKGENNQITYGDLGYFIAPCQGGKGIIPEVAKYVLNIYFRTFSVLDFTIHPDNVYSKRVAEKLNARLVGFIEKSGYQNQPRLCYQLSKKDFYAAKCICRSHLSVQNIQAQNQRD